MRLVRPSSPSSATITGPVIETLPTYSSGSTYALNDRVLTTDVSTGFEYIYESAQAANTGHALTDPAWWILVSAANPWRMFDNVSSSQTTSLTGSIVAVFSPDTIANTVALLNIVGSTAEVKVTVSGTTVYDETKSLTSAGDGVTDWYQYFFGDLSQRTDVLFADLPSYSGQQVTVTLTGTGTVAIGTLAVGYGYYLGDTQYGAGVGITDFSRKVVDDFGNYQIVKRAFSKRGSFTFRTQNSQIDALANLLPQFRAEAAVWIGADDYASTYIFGFYKDWNITIQYVSHSVVTLEIEGLT